MNSRLFDLKNYASYLVTVETMEGDPADRLKVFITASMSIEHAVAEVRELVDKKYTITEAKMYGSLITLERFAGYRVENPEDELPRLFASTGTY